MNNEATKGILLTVFCVAGVLFWLFSNPGRFSVLIVFVIAVLGASFALYSSRS